MYIINISVRAINNTYRNETNTLDQSDGESIRLCVGQAVVAEDGGEFKVKWTSRKNNENRNLFDRCLLTWKPKPNLRDGMYST